jgi:hypothetical protein
MSIAEPRTDGKVQTAEAAPCIKASDAVAGFAITLTIASGII